eukprot:jgi/Ulvmu1/2074/UM123_0006.1
MQARAQVETMNVEIARAPGEMFDVFAADSQCIELLLAGEDVALRSATGSLHLISGECVANSQLLQELVSSSGSQDITQVQVSEQAFRLWMHSVDSVTAMATSGSKS